MYLSRFQILKCIYSVINCKPEIFIVTIFMFKEKLAQMMRLVYMCLLQ